MTRIDSSEDDWPLTVTPASVRPHPNARAPTSATITARIAKNQKNGLR